MIKTATQQAELLDSELLDRACNTYRVLSHPVRLRIIEMLMREQFSVCELAEKIDLPQATLSQHLNRLRATGVVSGKRKGQKIFYSVISPHAHSLIAALRQHGDRI